MRRIKAIAGWLYWALSVAVMVWLVATVYQRRDPYQEISLLWQWTDDPVLRALIVGAIILLGIVLLPGMLSVMVWAFLASLALAVAMAVGFLLYELAITSTTGAILAGIITIGIVILLFNKVHSRLSTHNTSRVPTSFSSDYCACDWQPTTSSETRMPSEKVHGEKSEPRVQEPELFPELFSMEKCPDCDGERWSDQNVGDGKCKECHGSGANPDLLEDVTDALSGLRQGCPACRENPGRCTTCHGKGYL